MNNCTSARERAADTGSRETRNPAGERALIGRVKLVSGVDRWNYGLVYSNVAHDRREKTATIFPRHFESTRTTRRVYTGVCLIPAPVSYPRHSAVR